MLKVGRMWAEFVGRVGWPNGVTYVGGPAIHGSAVLGMRSKAVVLVSYYVVAIGVAYSAGVVHVGTAKKVYVKNVRWTVV